LYKVENGNLSVELENGEVVGLKNADQFIGFQGEEEAPTSILLKNNGLHIDVQVDGEHPVGKTDSANVKDVVIESAITRIIDCDDSVIEIKAYEKTYIISNLL